METIENYLTYAPPFYYMGWLTFGIVLGYLATQDMPVLLSFLSRTRSKLHFNTPPAHDRPMATHVDPAGNRWAANRPRRSQTIPA